MPYIKRFDREIFSTMFESLVAKTPGDLNYIFTKAALDYVDDHEEVTYQVLNDAMGAFECAKQEFYRRMVAPYEDKKIKENGDVYPAGGKHV